MSLLERRDPTVKLVVAIATSLLLVLVIDPVTPLLFGAAALTAGLTLGDVRPAAFLRVAAPLLVVALGLAWTNAAFARVGGTPHVIGALGPLTLTAEGLTFGVAIGLRGLAIGFTSVVFVLTTEPTSLVVSLIANARLPYRLGYPLLAAYRFVPFIAEEWAQIALAERLRGDAPGASPLARIARGPARLIPLLASAVRRAARVAIAMDARGFAGARERTYLREARITGADLAFALVALALAAALLAAGALGGWLRLWDGRFSV